MNTWMRALARGTATTGRRPAGKGRGKWIDNRVFACGQRVSYGCDGAHASGLPGLSRTFCDGSGGYVKEGLERATGMPVVAVEVFESLLRGGTDCRFKVTLKA